MGRWGVTALLALLGSSGREVVLAGTGGCVRLSYERAFGRCMQVSDEEGLRQMGLVPLDVGRLLLEAFADMTFVFGFIHGDPHPGGRAASILFAPFESRQRWHGT